MNREDYLRYFNSLDDDDLYYSHVTADPEFYQYIVCDKTDEDVKQTQEYKDCELFGDNQLEMARWTIAYKKLGIVTEKNTKNKYNKLNISKL